MTINPTITPTKQRLLKQLNHLMPTILIAGAGGIIVLSLISIVFGQLSQTPQGSLLSPLPETQLVKNNNQPLIAQGYTTPEIKKETTTTQPNISNKNTVILPANKTKLQINDSRITAESKIHISARSGAPVIIESQKANSFVVSVKNHTKQNLTIDYWIITP